MPLVSKAQARWAYANQNARGSTGDAAREFIAATPAGGIKKLPERVRSAKAQNKPRKPFGSFAP